MSDDGRLHRGRQVRIRLLGDDEWVRGVVVFAGDANPSPVILIIEDMLRSRTGMWIGGGMPLTVDYETETVKSLLGDEYEVDVEVPGDDAET